MFHWFMHSYIGKMFLTPHNGPSDLIFLLSRPERLNDKCVGIMCLSVHG